ncbi:MAG: transketolase [Acidimicrobiales bacterium]
MTDVDREQLGINVIRGLAMDAPQAAKNGHPGTAMALAPLAHVLWTRIMRYDAATPGWPDRDRFVLSNGHASILLYSMLYLTGYGLELEDIRQFRQWGSRTPGHPEVHHTAGVEVTTGPLGQGFANSAGLALAERHLRAKFGAELCDHHTFAIAGDGCLEEGISHEAASLAGHLGLGRLICVYDDNHISIDGPTELSMSDDPAGRFEAYGWHVENLGEVANDLDAIEGGIRRAMAVEDRPSLVILRSHIGYPSPKFTDSAKAHGDPLGDDEIRVTKAILGLPVDERFWVPDEVVDMYRAAGRRHAEAREAWESRLAAYGGDRDGWQASQEGRPVLGWEAKLPTWEAGGDPLATRQAANAALNAVADLVPGLMVGAADLTGNTGVKLNDEPIEGGRQVYYGIREHGMGAIMNGLALHGGIVPIGGTFFVFSDYMRGSGRLAALSGAKVIYFWSHDSVGLGQDGPTHQPIEQLAAMRAMPRLTTIRPADANETAHALRIALDGNGPVGVILTRQPIPVLRGTVDAFEGVSSGAYVIHDPSGAAPSIALVGTGSEVHVCLDAADRLAEQGVPARVVSFPSWELFELQDASYQASVFPPGVPRLAVEAASSFGWDRWAEASVSIDHFGASAPGDRVLAEFGYTADNVVLAAQALLDR